MKAMGATFASNENNDYFHIFSPHKEYIITKFQRNYTWGEYQTQGIIEDIEYIKSHNTPVGWPSILMQKEHNTLKPNIASYSLGDGQQRLTSVALFLLAIWQRGQNIKSAPGYVDNDEDDRFLSKIISSENEYGVIAYQKYTARGYHIEPIIKFQYQIANDAFYRLCDTLTKTSWDAIDHSISIEDENMNLHLAFTKYYNYLCDKDFDFTGLEEIYDILTTKIFLTVLEYNHDEDMQRSFSNMNSFGVPLQENELIKADLYGLIKLKNPDLADEVADYWTNTLSSSHWKKKWHSKSLDNVRVLDYCLEQILYSYGENENEVRQGDRDNISREEKLSNPHWLRDNWRKFLQKKSSDELSEFWENLKDDFDMCSIIFSLKPYHSASREWEISYNYQILETAKLTSYLSVMLLLQRSINNSDLSPFQKEMELISVLRMYTKYFMSLMVSHGSQQAVSNFLMRLTSPQILSLKLYTTQGLKSYLESQISPQRKWLSKDEITSRIANMSYTNSRGINAILTEAFLYVHNEEKRNSGDKSTLLNTRDIRNVFDISKSREHILPQKPRLTEQDDAYNRSVSMLGNALPLEVVSNSRASNKVVKDKLEEYKKANGVFEYWAKDFLAYYNENGFEADDIELRTLILAERFAKVIASDNPNKINPNSRYNSLLRSYRPGQVFAFKNQQDEWEDISLNEAGELLLTDGKIITMVTELNDLLLSKAKKDWRSQIYIERNGSYVTLFSDIPKQKNVLTP